ncbi:MAG: SAV_6107 family HEPN domain-containing protein [Actinomycetota bacterium]|nr:SAV_6107 family HEPN domain-containing protein [Actinomycetota bacterium]
MPTMPLTSSATTLLATARRDLAEATLAPTAIDRYAAAHRGALRTAAAVLAVRTRPDPRHRRPRSAWVLLARVAPELGEWAQFFAAGASKRAAAEAGLRSAATTREADDLLRDAEAFLALAETTLGLDSQAVLPVSGALAAQR